MTVIAYAGEQIKGRDGKVIATLAQDIHSGDLNLRPNQFVMEGGDTGGFLPEEVYEFVRGKLSSPSPDPNAAKPEVAVKPKAAKAKRSKRG